MIRFESALVGGFPVKRGQKGLNNMFWESFRMMLVCKIGAFTPSTLYNMFQGMRSHKSAGVLLIGVLIPWEILSSDL